MDHLPPVLNSKPYQVRCICDFNDSPPYVLGYSEDKGWMVQAGQSIIRIDGRISTSEEIAAFIQKWLYFGLLSDALALAGISVNLSDFHERIQLPSGESLRIVTTSKLRQYLSRWEDRERNSNEYRRQERQAALVRLLKPLEHFVYRQDYSRQSIVIDNNVMLSMVILGETLKNAATYIWRLPLESYPLRGVGFIQKCNPLTDQLLQSGRCLSESLMLYERLDNTGIYVASLIPTPHNSRIPNHNNCASTFCSAFQLDEATYETAHATGCPSAKSCPFISVNSDDLRNILRDGHIPLIQILGDDNHIRLKVVSSSAKAPYIAFSHVWAHGLGNVGHNALPKCQLRRLKTLASDLLGATQATSGPLIWIDTLCIPVDPALKTYRNIAIARLGKTFALSTKVLVLDFELEHTYVPCSRLELATRLLCSGWMRRLWTLQEAVISADGGPNLRKLWLQSHDRAVSFHSIFEDGVDSLFHTDRAIQVILDTFPQVKSSTQNLATLSRALMYRSTSKLADEAICLGSVLNLDVSSIIEAGKSVDDRMKSFYAQITEFPIDILFHKGDGLPQKGYRWAPRSFLAFGYGQSSFFRLDDRKPVRRDKEGLHVQLAGFIVKSGVKAPRGRTIGDHFHFLDPDVPEILWQLSPEPRPSSVNPFANREAWLLERTRVAKFDTTVRAVESVGILLRKSEKNVSMEGVMIELDGKKKGLGKEEIGGQYLCRIQIYQRKTQGKGLEELEGVFGQRLAARGWSDAQRWCVE